MNDRKIPLSIEVGFWNLIIAFLTIFRDIRTFAQTTPATMPSLKKKEARKFVPTQNKLIGTKNKINRIELYKLVVSISLLAIFGFVLGFLSGILIGI